MDISIQFSADDLEKLDRDAERAEKALDRRQKAVEKSGGIYGLHEGKALPKSTIAQLEKSRLERDSKAVGAQIPKGILTSEQGAPIKRFNLADEVKSQKGILESLLTSELGSSQAQEAFGWLKDPIGKFKQFASKELPAIAAVVIIGEIVDEVIKWLTAKGGWLDQTFRDTISNRVDALRDKMQQSSIRAGFTQIIITTKSGHTNPRDSYNTYYEYNKNNKALEDSFAIRNTRGI